LKPHQGMDCHARPKISAMYANFISGNVSRKGFLSVIQNFVYFFCCFIKTRWISSKHTSCIKTTYSEKPEGASSREGRYSKFLKTPLKPGPYCSAQTCLVSDLQTLSSCGPFQAIVTPTTRPSRPNALAAPKPSSLLRLLSQKTTRNISMRQVSAFYFISCSCFGLPSTLRAT
jgi:hypothetical protein